MSAATPVTQLAHRFSSPDASAGPWEDARDELAQAQLYWVSTVRPAVPT